MIKTFYHKKIVEFGSSKVSDMRKLFLQQGLKTRQNKTHTEHKHNKNYETVEDKVYMIKEK